MRLLIVLCVGLAVGGGVGIAGGALWTILAYRLLTDRGRLACADGCVHFHQPGTAATEPPLPGEATAHFLAAVRANVIAQDRSVIDVRPSRN